MIVHSLRVQIRTPQASQDAGDTKLKRSEVSLYLSPSSRELCTWLYGASDLRGIAILNKRSRSVRHRNICKHVILVAMI